MENNTAVIDDSIFLPLERFQGYRVPGGAIHPSIFSNISLVALEISFVLRREGY